MGYGKEFYITLRSDECDKYFPNNTSTNFYCKLPYTLNLDGEWYVGVNQIWIDKMWYNMEGIEIQFTENDGTYNGELPVKIFKLKDGYYHTTETLLTNLNVLCMLDSLKLCTFSMDPYSHKVTLKVADGYTMVMTTKLCDVLGMLSYIFVGEVTGVKCVDIHKHDGLLYIRTNIVSGYGYTNTQGDIIKTLSTNRYRFGEVIYDRFLADHTRVFMNCLDTIHIQITKRDTSIKQMGGCTLIQLHFMQG